MKTNRPPPWHLNMILLTLFSWLPQAGSAEIGAEREEFLAVLAGAKPRGIPHVQSQFPAGACLQAENFRRSKDKWN